MRMERRCCFTARERNCECSAGILPAVPRLSRPRFETRAKCRRTKVSPRAPDEASGAALGLTGVDIES
jgi:hypothetical protein